MWGYPPGESASPDIRTGHTLGDTLWPNEAGGGSATLKQEQKNPCESFLTKVAMLVNQILLVSDVLHQ